MLAREVLRLRGTLASREVEWDVVVDLYFYRDPEAEENKETGEEAKVAGADEVGETAIATGFAGNADWEVSGTTAQPSAAFGDGAAAAQPATNWDTNEPTGGEWATGGAAVQAAPDSGW